MRNWWQKWVSAEFVDDAVSKLYTSSTFVLQVILHQTYRKTSNISRTLVENKIVDHSDVVWASPVGAAPTTSSFST